MIRSLLIIGLLNWLVSPSCFAQDERYFRRLFSGEAQKSSAPEMDKTYKMKVNSPLYRLDLVGDTQKEGLNYEHKDGEDWFYVIAANGKALAKYQFETKGHDSKVFKISLRKLSERTKLLIIYFYEGFHHYLEFEGSTRVYFLTIDDRDAKKINFYQGPVVWHEFEDGKEHYHQRYYHVDLEDLNHDGIQEIRVRTKENIYVYLYSDFGKWNRI